MKKIIESQILVLSKINKVFVPIQICYTNDDVEITVSYNDTEYCAKGKYQDKTDQSSCKNCPAGSRSNKDGSTRRYYMCYSRAGTDKDMVIDPNCKNKNYRDRDLEAIIYTEIRKLKSNPLYIEELRDSVDHSAILEAAEKRILAIESQLSKIMDLYSIGQMDLDMVKNKAQKLSEEKKQLEAEVEEHKSLAVAQMDKQEIMDIVDLFEDAIESGDNAKVNNVIADLIEYIEIENELIKIHWNF